MNDIDNSRSTVDSEAHRLVAASGNRKSEYQSITNDVLGIDFPDEYIARGECLLLVNRAEEVCGGAMVVSQAPFRSLASIPTPLGQTRKLNLQSSKLAEINGVWLAGNTKTQLVSLNFWQLMIEYLLECGNEKFLFTFDNSNGRMLALAKWLEPEVLYSGKTLLQEGMKSSSDETVALVEAKQLVAFLLMLNRRGGRDKRTNEERRLANNLVARKRRRSA